MKRRKKLKILPYLFLGALMCICIFIVGQRYGVHVARVNKTLAVLITPTPTLTVGTPTPIPTIGFNRTSKNTCGISFLYPSNLAIESESTRSAVLQNSDQQIKIKCDLTTFDTFGAEGSPLDIQLLSRPVTASSGAFLQPSTNTAILFSFIHPRTGEKIHIIGTKELVTLFVDTIKIEPTK